MVNNNGAGGEERCAEESQDPVWWGGRWVKPLCLASSGVMAYPRGQRPTDHLVAKAVGSRLRLVLSGAPTGRQMTRTWTQAGGSSRLAGRQASRQAGRQAGTQAGEKGWSSCGKGIQKFRIAAQAIYTENTEHEWTRNRTQYRSGWKYDLAMSGWRSWGFKEWLISGRSFTWRFLQDVHAARE